MDTSRKMAKDFPLVGTGSGTYGSIYPLYNQGGPQEYYARCDAMQFRVENGWVGILLAGIGLVVYVATAVVGLIKMRDKFMRRILLGTLLGSLAVLGHGLMEYDLYVPATALVFVVLAAVTVVLAQDHNSRQREEDYAF
jgi:O-antigen ligase